MEYLRGVFGGGGSLRYRIQATARKIGRHSNRARSDSGRSGGGKRGSRHHSGAPGDHYREDSSRCPGRHAPPIQRQGRAGENGGAQWRFLHPAACEVAGEQAIPEDFGRLSQEMESLIFRLLLSRVISIYLDKLQAPSVVCTHGRNNQKQRSVRTW